jgi:hypothetical protein
MKVNTYIFVTFCDKFRLQTTGITVRHHQLNSDRHKRYTTLTKSMCVSLSVTLLTKC